MFLIALEKINQHLGVGEREVQREECLVFEDSVAGVEAGRRAGMRVVWVPHLGLRKIWMGREEVVLGGRSGEVDDGEEDGQLEGQSRLWSEDGWAELRMSLEGFDYDFYGIRLKDGRS